MQLSPTLQRRVMTTSRIRAALNHHVSFMAQVWLALNLLRGGV